MNAAGNRQGKEVDEAITEYAWDATGRLTEVEPPVNDPSTFSYNAAGKRVGKTVGEQGKRFLYDFNRLLQESDADTGETEMLYTSTTDEYGDLISEYGEAGSKYHHYDASGSTDALQDPEGTGDGDTNRLWSFE
ncbi:MAG TPA: hypothetical protein VMY42_28325 [Thermoguttaceae bacterium]|nr:hypothetical protein [Thermoguttaceae bacterium]